MIKSYNKVNIFEVLKMLLFSTHKKYFVNIGRPKYWLHMLWCNFLFECWIFLCTFISSLPPNTLSPSTIFPGTFTSCNFFLHLVLLNYCYLQPLSTQYPRILSNCLPIFFKICLLVILYLLFKFLGSCPFLLYVFPICIHPNRTGSLYWPYI